MVGRGGRRDRGPGLEGDHRTRRPPDPAAPGTQLGHGAVVVDSALLVAGWYFLAEEIRVRRPRRRAAALTTA